MIGMLSCAVCRSQAHRLVAGYLPLCDGCARAMARSQGLCSRCMRSLRSVPNYVFEGRLYCGDCVDVVRRIRATLRPEPVGLYQDEDDRQAEVLAWVCIMESMLE